MCTKVTTGLIGVMWLACVMLGVEAYATQNCTVTTFDEALQECVTQLGIPSERLNKEYKLLLYPSDRDSMCLVRCIGVLLRFWNDTTGIREQTIRQYYQPDPEDHCYQNRTRICLDALEPSVTDVCERAHRSFLCYHQQFGYLQRNDRYIPKTALEMGQIQQDCLDVFGLSSRRLKQYQDGHFPDDPETQCFVRCVGLRTGLYTDEHGPNVDRLYIQCDSCADEAVFRERASECIAAQRRHKLSKCTAAYRTLYQCFRDDQLDLYASITTTRVPTTKHPKTTTNSGTNMLPAYPVKESGDSHIHLIPSQIEIILKTLYNGKY
uniref:Uncharacterized protein n=1 Tax=Anopheles culicifacies TaxID=139723 RepID=A0A182LTZ3_9DIPT